MRVRGWLPWGFLVLGLFGVAVAWAQEAAPGTYTVKKGDTLWDISSGVLKDPFLWPKLWSANPNIKNPDRIYPGQVLNLPVTAPSAAAPTAPATPAEPALPTERIAREKVPEAEAAPVPEERPPAPMPEVLMASSGFLAAPQELRGEIVGSWDSRKLLGEGDTVYIKVDRASPGERLTVVRLDRRIVHPVTGKDMGYLVKVLGHVKVLSVEQNVAKAQVERSFDWIEEGDRVVTARPVAWKPGQGPAAPVSGYIVASKDNKQGLGERDIVYLDRGERDGLVQGTRFTILEPSKRVRVPSSGQWVTLPDQVVGEAVVLALQANTATALITRSLKEIATGYKVRTQTP